MLGRLTISTFGVVLAALGAALLLPLLFGDPNGVDPNGLRLGAVSLGLVGCTYAWPALRPARPIALAVGCAVIPYVLWAAALQVVPWWWPGASDGVTLLAAGALQLVATIVLVLVIRRGAGDLHLRLRALGRRALAYSLGLCVIFLLVMLAIPATLLGRIGIPIPYAMSALGNGLIGGDVLQAFSQELQFRGVLMGVLERDLPAWQANLAQSVFFGLGHLALEQYEGPIVTLIPLTIALGFVLGWITQRTRSLWPAIIIHVVAEVAVRVAVLPGLYGG